MPQGKPPPESDLDARLRVRIDEERRLRGLPYNMLAQKMRELGLPHLQDSVPWKIVTGGRRVSGSELIVIAQIFEMSVEELAGVVPPSVDPPRQAALLARQIVELLEGDPWTL